MALTEKDKKNHANTLRLAKTHKVVESEIVLNLQEVDRDKTFRKYDCASVFEYAVKYYDFTRDIAYAFKSVAKTAMKYPALQAVVETNQLRVAAAKRLVPHLTEERADEIVNYAVTHSHRETEIYLGNLGTALPPIEKVKRIGGGQVQLTITMSAEEFEELERNKAIEAQNGRNHSNSEAICKSIRFFNERKDPVKRAERAEKRRTKKEVLGAPLKKQQALQLSAVDVHPLYLDSNIHFFDIAATFGRENMTAEQLNAAMARDGGCCTQLDKDGNRCGKDRWVHLHHIVSIADGGSNHPTNLTTLCSFHHDLAHQLELPLGKEAGSKKSLNDGNSEHFH